MFVFGNVFSADTLYYTVVVQLIVHEKKIVCYPNWCYTKIEEEK